MDGVGQKGGLAAQVSGDRKVQVRWPGVARKRRCRGSSDQNGGGGAESFDTDLFYTSTLGTKRDLCCYQHGRHTPAQGQCLGGKEQVAAVARSVPFFSRG